MRLIVALLAMWALALAIWTVAIDCLGHRATAAVSAEVHRADFQFCVPVRSPPLGKPHRRINGAAPISELS